LPVAPCALTLSGALDPTSPTPDITFIDLLGMRVSCVTFEETVRHLLCFIASGQSHHITTADASAVVIAAEDPDFLRIVNESALVTPDGTGILWASRRLGMPLKERVSGVDLAERLCAESARHGFSLYFYGAMPGVAEAAAERMRARYPGTRIVGITDGFQSSAEQQSALLADIQAKRPDVLLVALGFPRQSKWIDQHLRELGVPVAMGVGGTFDVLSGQIRRAPVWMQRVGLEWLYRLIKDPSKASKVAALPVFALRVLRRERLPASD
jgi:N-acetylglucosaminyldiphosphoundecaprenol N-acetyl-beta-D-mannosaminyltransferase